MKKVRYQLQITTNLWPTIEKAEVRLVRLVHQTPSMRCWEQSAHLVKGMIHHTCGINYLQIILRNGRSPWRANFLYLIRWINGFQPSYRREKICQDKVGIFPRARLRREIRYASRTPSCERDRHQHCVNYDEVFALVAKYTSIRTLPSLNVLRQYCIPKLGDRSYFMNGSVVEDIYIQVPRGMSIDKTCEIFFGLHKALYGLKRTELTWDCKKWGINAPLRNEKDRTELWLTPQWTNWRQSLVFHFYKNSIQRNSFTLTSVSRQSEQRRDRRRVAK